MPADLGTKITRAAAGAGVPILLYVWQRRRARERAELAGHPLGADDPIPSQKNTLPNAGSGATRRLWAVVGAAIAMAVVVGAFLAGGMYSRFVSQKVELDAGWYLMSPPLGELGNRRPIPDATAPLSKWNVEHAFGTPQECEDFRENTKWKRGRQRAKMRNLGDQWHQIAFTG